jgi:hypothetical protein
VGLQGWSWRVPLRRPTGPRQTPSERSCASHCLVLRSPHSLEARLRPALPARLIALIDTEAPDIPMREDPPACPSPT